MSLFIIRMCFCLELHRRGGKWWISSLEKGSLNPKIASSVKKIINFFLRIKSSHITTIITTANNNMNNDNNNSFTSFLRLYLGQIRTFLLGNKTMTIRGFKSFQQMAATWLKCSQWNYDIEQKVIKLMISEQQLNRAIKSKSAIHVYSQLT